MNLVPPVYDRTELDIRLQTKKGFLNVEDYQRIEANLQALSEIFDIEITGNIWGMASTPTPQRMGLILQNLQAVRDAYYPTPDTPATPELPVNHFEKVNDIEHIIWLLWHYWTANTEDAHYCGEELYAGEEIGVL